MKMPCENFRQAIFLYVFLCLLVEWGYPSPATVFIFIDFRTYMPRKQSKPEKDIYSNLTNVNRTKGLSAMNQVYSW